MVCGTIYLGSIPSVHPKDYGGKPRQASAVHNRISEGSTPSPATKSGYGGTADAEDSKSFEPKTRGGSSPSTRTIFTARGETVNTADLESVFWGFDSLRADQ